MHPRYRAIPELDGIPHTLYKPNRGQGFGGLGVAPPTAYVEKLTGRVLSVEEYEAYVNSNVNMGFSRDAIVAAFTPVNTVPASARTPAAQGVQIPEGYSAFRDSRGYSWAVVPNDVYSQLPLVTNPDGEPELPGDVYELVDRFGLSMSQGGNGIYFVHKEIAPTMHDVIPALFEPPPEVPTYQLPPHEAESVPGYTLFYRLAGTAFAPNQVMWWLMPDEWASKLTFQTDKFGYKFTDQNPVDVIPNDPNIAVSGVDGYGLLEVIWYLDRPPPLSGLSVTVGPDYHPPIEYIGREIIPGETLVSTPGGDFVQARPPPSGEPPAMGPGSYVPDPQAVADLFGNPAVLPQGGGGYSQIPEHGNEAASDGAAPPSMGKMLGLASLAFVGFAFLGKDKKPTKPRKRRNGGKYRV